MLLSTPRDRRIFKILYLVYSLTFLGILYNIPLTITSILGIAQSLLTVEGILLGLTPLTEKPEARAWPFFIGTVAVLFSLITIVVEESAATTGIGGPLNWILLFLDAEFFLVMMTVYYASATRPTPEKDSTPKPPPLSEEPDSASSQPGRKNVLELIDRVDDRFSQWRWGLVGYIWIAVLVVVLVAVDVTELTYQDLGTRFAVAAAGIAVFLSMGQLILDRVDSWIAGTNYRRLLVGQDDPLLYALILMKTDHPSIPLRTVQGLNPKLFEPQALTESLYK